MMSTTQRKQTTDGTRKCGRADFTRPLALMLDCHRRIEHFLAVLHQVVARCATGYIDADNRLGLAIALNYFQQAAPRHTTDEEQSLFPRLRQCADPALRAALEELDRLESDHQRAGVVHQAIAELGSRWLQVGQLDAVELGRLRSLLAELTSVYTDHIRVEDNRVYAAAARVLTAAELRAVGAEMQERRTADPGRAGSRCAARRQQRSPAEQP